MTWLFEPGFFSSGPVHVALLIGGAAAMLSAVVGVFTVLRGQSFAGHSLTDISAAGGSGAVLVGINPLLGFVGFGVLGAGVMDLIGVQRVRGRDLATGIVLGASIGLAALFLFLDTSSGNNNGVTQQILFGSIFTVSSDTVPIVVGFGLVSLAILTAIYRPLVMSSVSAEVAQAMGVPVRLVGLAFMTCMATAVGMSALAIGAILSTALLVGPAAAALRMTSRLSSAMVVACVIGVGTTYLGILFAYDSYDWDPSHLGFPVSFFVTVLVLFVYLASGLGSWRARLAERRSARPGTPPSTGASAGLAARAPSHQARV